MASLRVVVAAAASPSASESASEPRMTEKQNRQPPRQEKQKTAVPPRARKIRQSVPSLSRSQVVSKDVIARTTGRKLGKIVQLSCDADTLEVISLNVQKSGTLLIDKVEPRDILLSELRQLGDVALVETEDVVETKALWGNIVPTSLINMSVVTEDAEYVGKVRDFRFNPQDGRIQSLITDEVGWLLPVVLPENCVSTYLIDVSEVVQVGQDRIIILAGAEKRLKQLSVGIFGQMSLASPVWEKEQVYGMNEKERMDYDYMMQDKERQQMYSNSYSGQLQRRWELPEPSMQYAPSRTRQQQQQQQQQKRREPTGIPIVSPPPPYRRRDADGGFGERPPIRQQQRQQQSYRDSRDPPSIPFDEWVDQSETRTPVPSGDDFISESPNVRPKMRAQQGQYVSQKDLTSRLDGWSSPPPSLPAQQPSASDINEDRI